MSPRRRLAELAAESGLGDIHRVHRSRHDAGELFPPFVIALALGGGLLLSVRFGWPSAAALLVAVLLGAKLLAYALPLRQPKGRLWIAVCTGGLITLAQDGTVTRGAWADVARADPFPIPRGLHFGGMNELYRAIGSGRPAPFPHLRYTRNGCALALAVGTILWFLFVPRQEDAPAASISELSRACEGRGIAYTASAAYAGNGPHPIAIVGDGVLAAELESIDGSARAPFAPRSPGEVQLIACVRRIEVGDYTDDICSYDTISVTARFGAEMKMAAPTPERVRIRSARYAIDVIEARTNRAVAHVELTGVGSTCPESFYPNGSDPNLYRHPTGAQYRQHLARLVLDDLP